jgi:carboxyl-terminal processing protease
LPWDKIDAAPYKTWSKNANFEKAIANSNKRLSESNQFKLIDENAKWLSKRKDDTKYSLNFDSYKKAQQQLDLESKKFKAINSYKGQLTFNSLPYENELMEKDNVLKEKRKRWHESLNKDAYVEEALNILDDLQSSPIIQSKLPLKDKKAKTVGSL